MDNKEIKPDQTTATLWQPLIFKTYS